VLRDAAGAGVASAICRTLIGQARQTLGVERVSWQSTEGNDASRRLAERLGFRHTRIRSAERASWRVAPAHGPITDASRARAAASVSDADAAVTRSTAATAMDSSVSAAA